MSWKHQSRDDKAPVVGRSGESVISGAAGNPPVESAQFVDEALESSVVGSVLVGQERIVHDSPSEVLIVSHETPDQSPVEALMKSTLIDQANKSYLAGLVISETKDEEIDSKNMIMFMAVVAVILIVAVSSVP
jgi:hypothetical protein